MTAPVIRLAGIAGAVLIAGPALAGGCGVECYRRVHTPPIYDTISEPRLVRPPRTIYRTTPPVYDTVAENVLVHPGGRSWQTRRDAFGQLIGCWVHTPPRYALRYRRVLVQPAQVIPETIPPAYANYRHRVLVQPASTAWVPADGGYGVGAGLGIGSIPDAFGIAGASSADVAVGLGFSTGSIYDGY